MIEKEIFKTINFLDECIIDGGLRKQKKFKETKENKPLISIITVVYNNEKYLEESILSLHQQNYDNYEHIIVDGGSKDNTIKILEKLKKNNKYLRIFKKKNFGIYQSINYGIKKSRYNHVALLHSDDFFKNDNVLVNIMNNFKSNPNLLSVHSNVEIVKRLYRQGTL